MRVGIGYDVHAFAEDRQLIIGGVHIPHTRGLLGHSDADVLVHAIMDALLGAMGEPDIGTLFPDTDAVYKDIDSLKLLARVRERMREKGYVLVNLDAVILAQSPKMMPHIPQMRERIAGTLETEGSRIGIKATTTEWLGFVGREEGMAAQCVCLIEEQNSVE